MNRDTFRSRRGTPFVVERLLALLAALAAIPGCAGSVNDYLEEAKLGDPESIKEAVVMTGALLSQKEHAGYPYDAGDEEAIKFLTEVAQKSPDAVNRASAVDSLSRLRRPKLTSTYIRALEDKSWSVQLEAVKALERNPAPEAVDPLSSRLAGEVSLAVRLEIVKALAIVGGEASLKKLLEVFLERSTRFQNMKLAAYDGVRKLSGKDFAFDSTESWRGYLAERFPEPKQPAAATAKPPSEKAAPEKPAPDPTSASQKPAENEKRPADPPQAAPVEPKTNSPEPESTSAEEKK